MKRRNLKKAYFTLVELMVVITIIGLLGGIVGVAVFQKVGQAKIATTRASIGEYSKAINFFFMDTGKYPAALNDLYVKPEGVKGWKGPYITREVQADPWHNPFVYSTSTGSGSKPFQIYSVGPDQVEGGDDDIFEFEDEAAGGGASGDAKANTEPAADPK